MFKCIEDANIIRGYFVEIGYEDVFDYFIKYNDGENNPYHNNVHTFNVVEIIKGYCDRYDVGNSLRTVCMIAALFHDFNHSGNGSDDSLNIIRAIEGLNECLHDLNLTSPTNKRFILSGYRMMMISLIKYTQYPYKMQTKEEREKFQFLRVLRKADILSYEHDKWGKYVYEGLCNELMLDKENIQENMLRMLQFHENLCKTEIECGMGNDYFSSLKIEHYQSFRDDVYRVLNVYNVVNEENIIKN